MFLVEKMASRYLAQTRVEEFGEQSIGILSNSSVLIVGCGALGSPVAMYLAGAGVGRIVLADFDNVELSNLHRQVFYSEESISRNKAVCLQSQIKALNSEIEVEVWEKFISPVTLTDKNSDFDVIIDAADNPSTTYFLSEFCRSNRIPFSTAGVSGWKAQVFTYIPGSLSFDDIFPKPQENQGILPCSIAGIAGPTAAFAASIQASETLKILLGQAGKESVLIIGDLLSLEIRKVC